jgi:hypothetical protein
LVHDAELERRMKTAFPRWIRGFALAALGAALVLCAAPIVERMAAPDRPVMWWSARALGMVAYVALWLASLFGVLVGGRGAGGRFDRATVMQLHDRWALAALASTGLHVLMVVGDFRSGVSPLAVFVPGISERLAGSVTLGTVALYGVVSVALTTYFADRVPRVVWRATHSAAFGTYLLALFHGIFAGSESSVPIVRAFYVGTASLLVVSVAQRVSIQLGSSTSNNGASS